jgi:peptidoglycan/LPS O-acetylase OafA/YrhL
MSDDLALTQRTTRSRYVELDALRGIAACTVVLHHIYFAYSEKFPGIVKPLILGHQAVMLFFVLSGFVLSLPFWSTGSTGPYGSYILRRFFRIYVPFVIALLIAASGEYFFPHSQLNLNAYFNKTWQTDLSSSLLVSQLLMYPSPELNTAFWSLRYEMQMSIVFPLLLLCLRRIGTCWSLTLAVVIYLFGAYAPPYWNVDFILDTARYSALFVLGAVLASKREALHKLWSLCSPSLSFLIVAASVVAYMGGQKFTKAIHLEPMSDLLLGVASCGLILSAISARPLRQVLQHRVPQFLGRISYSVYLLHGTILFAMLNLWYARIGKYELSVLVITGSLLASYVFCIAVEEPASRLGKRFAMSAAGIS